MLLDEIATRIGLLNLGPTIIKGSMPGSPDEVIVLTEYGGSPPSTGLGVAGIQYETPGLQIRVRGKAYDLQTPMFQIRQIYLDMAKIQAMTLSGTLYLMVRPQQSPFILEQDTNNRWTHVFNVLCEKAP